MPAPLTDRALILRRFAYGESSLVVQLLTRSHGRVHLIAKGAYRPTSRYYAALDLFDSLELSWQPSRSSELGTLRAASIARRRDGVARGLEGYRAGLCVLELADLGAQEALAAPELFDLAERALERIAAGAIPPQRALVEFELGFLQTLGLAPALASCAACGGPAPAVPGDPSGPRAAFSAGAGGRLCGDCAAQARASGRRVGTLPAGVLSAAGELLGGAAGAEGLSGEAIERVRDFAARFLEYHLESRPESYRDFLAVPNRNRPQG